MRMDESTEAGEDVEPEKTGDEPIRANLSAAPCHIMPEHVVGANNKPNSKLTKKRPTAAQNSGSGTARSVNLTYLNQNEEAPLLERACDDEAQIEACDNPVMDEVKPNVDANEAKESAVPVMKRRKFKGNVRTRTQQNEDSD